MDRAGTAQRGSAAKFCAGHSEHVAHYPKQWSVVVDVNAVSGSVDLEIMGHGCLQGGWASAFSKHIAAGLDLAVALGECFQAFCTLPVKSNWRKNA